MKHFSGEWHEEGLRYILSRAQSRANVGHPYGTVRGRLGHRRYRKDEAGTRILALFVRARLWSFRKDVL